jgi:hypothetical protein
MSVLDFLAFPKIGRMTKGVTITEKIDGTNAQLNFDAFGNMLVGSRKRQIFPEGTFFGGADYDDGGVLLPVKGTDNFTFAKWAYDNQAALFDFLGEGRHYGEWAGNGIQRTYDLDTKRFYLFNTGRFGPGKQVIPDGLKAVGLSSVPVLYEGELKGDTVDTVMATLKMAGSLINTYDNPEGIIVYMHGPGVYFKETYEYNKGKWESKYEDEDRVAPTEPDQSGEAPRTAKC